MDQVHKRIYEMANTRGYEALHKLIEQEFPYLNEDEIKRVHESVMECVNFKDHVRNSFIRFLEATIRSCSSETYSEPYQTCKMEFFA